MTYTANNPLSEGGLFIPGDLILLDELVESDFANIEIFDFRQNGSPTIQNPSLICRDLGR
jgi:hypothetical protein